MMTRKIDLDNRPYWSNDFDGSHCFAEQVNRRGGQFVMVHTQDWCFSLSRAEVVELLPIFQKFANGEDL